MDDDAHCESERSVHRTHQFCIARGQVIVHGHDMNWNPGEGRRASGQRGRERLALARVHFSDQAVQQHAPTEELHVKGALPHGPTGSFPHKREGMGHHVVSKSILQESGTEAISGLPKVCIAQVRATPTLISDHLDELRSIVKPTP